MFWHVSIILGVTSLVQCIKLHEMMTDNEFARVFRMPRDTVPKYEVVPIMHNLYKRANSNLRMRFNAFGKDIDSYLNPSDGQLAGCDTPVWLAFTNENGTISYRKLGEGIVGISVTFYSTSYKLSSVIMIRNDRSIPHFEGSIHGLTVRPLPERLQEVARSKRGIQPSNLNETRIESHYHVIIKSSSFPSEEQVSESVNGKTSEIFNFLTESDDLRAKRSSEAIVFPSIMITTDYETSKLSEHDSDYYHEITYQLAYWNAVDLRFRQVQVPKIRLRIAGIIIGLDRTATPYINNAMANVRFFDADKAMMFMRSFWNKIGKRPEFSNDAYHIVVTMTDRKIVRVSPGEKDEAVTGVATFRGLCVYRLNTYGPVALIYDDGNFTGIFTTAHELAHLMGVDHDNSDGGECDVSRGFIMAPRQVSSNPNRRWSPCTLREFAFRFENRYLLCADQPSQVYPPGNPVDRLLPGSISDDHKQCQSHGFDWACSPTPEMCKVMRCYYTGWNIFDYGWWCYDSFPAVDGTICSPGHQCISGECKCLTKDCLFENVK